MEIIHMALVDITVGKSRRKHTEFVVVGEEGRGMRLGEVRWIEWDRSKTSSILRVEYADPKERTRVVNIEVTPKYRRRGWKLLREMFAEDEAVAEYWNDYVRFADAQRDDPEGMAGKEFPRRLLPKALLEMQDTAKVSKASRTDFEFSDGSKLSDETPGLKKAPAKRKTSASPLEA